MKLAEFKPHNITGGYFPRSTIPVRLASGRAYSAGSVLALTSTKTCVLVDSKTDNKVVHAVLAEDVDATDKEMVSVGFTTGEFAPAGLTFGGDDTYETHADGARKNGIHFVTSTI